MTKSCFLFLTLPFFLFLKNNIVDARVSPWPASFILSTNTGLRIERCSTPSPLSACRPLGYLMVVYFNTVYYFQNQQLTSYLPKHRYASLSSTAWLKLIFLKLLCNRQILFKIKKLLFSPYSSPYDKDRKIGEFSQESLLIWEKDGSVILASHCAVKQLITR